jgi:hypothetical protein
VGRRASARGGPAAQVVANIHAVMPVRLMPRRARRTCAVSTPIGRFDRAPIAQVHSNWHCSCSGWLRPSTATHRAEPQAFSSPEVRLSSSLLVQATVLCTHAPMRRAVPPTALLGCLLLRRSQRPRPSGSGRSRCLCSAHPGRACACTPPHRVAQARSIDSIAASTRLLSAARRRGVC